MAPSQASQLPHLNGFTHQVGALAGLMAPSQASQLPHLNVFTHQVGALAGLMAPSQASQLPHLNGFTYQHVGAGLARDEVLANAVNLRCQPECRPQAF